MVAESTEILAPMSQFGCATAWAGVTAAISARLKARNGPPEAVRTRRSTLCGRSWSSTWKMALCSESTGSSCEQQRFTSAVIRLPAQTRVSLLASPTKLPWRTDERGGERDRYSLEEGQSVAEG